MMITASTTPERFCWYSRLRSIVRKTSNSLAASCNSSPFFTPAHPASATVLMSWPGNSFRNARGTHSSSSTRIGDQMCLGLLEGCNSNIPADGREIVKKLVKRVAAFNVVDEGLHGHASAHKHGGAPQNLRVGANDRLFFHRVVL